MRLSGPGSSGLPFLRSQAVIRAAAARGLLVLTAGARECIRLLPPLTVSEEEVDICLRVLGEAVREVASA